MRKAWTAAVTAALLLPAGTYSADLIFPAGASIAPARTPDHLYIAPSAPIVAQVTIANNTGSVLRGVCYGEHVPSVFGVETLAVSIDGTPVTDYDYEVSDDDIYPHTRAHRWILEEPGRYAEMDNPLPSGGVLTISYRVISTGYYAPSWPPYFLTCQRELPSPEYYFGYCDDTLLVNPDTDGDGYSDGHEVDEGSDREDPASQPAVVAVVKEVQGGDQNLYLYDVSKAGDRTYPDAAARNPAPFARDLWVIPAGDGIVGLVFADADADGRDELAVVKESAGDRNLYLYNMPHPNDWTYWDAASRNPSPLARDFWLVPSGVGVFGMANAGDVDTDGRDDIAVLKDNVGDQNLYVYSVPAVGDWTYWDAAARNPSPLARDLWRIPGNNDTVSLQGVDADGDGAGDRLAGIRSEGGDQNLYLWNVPAAGDWTYWDAAARNPSPLARDLWMVPSGNSVIAAGCADADGVGGDELCVMKDENGDQNFYVFNVPAAGDRTYWDALSRNLSPLARDFWLIPSGSTAAFMTAK